MGFYTRGEHPTNDIGNSPHCLPYIPYDAFCIMHDDVSTQHTNVEIWAKTVSWRKWQPRNQDRRPWLCRLIQVSLGIYRVFQTFFWPAEFPGYHQCQQESQ